MLACALWSVLSQGPHIDHSRPNANLEGPTDPQGLLDRTSSVHILELDWDPFASCLSNHLGDFVPLRQTRPTASL